MKATPASAAQLGGRAAPPRHSREELTEARGQAQPVGRGDSQAVEDRQGGGCNRTPFAGPNLPPGPIDPFEIPSARSSKHTGAMPLEEWREARNAKGPGLLQGLGRKVVGGRIELPTHGFSIHCSTN